MDAHGVFVVVYVFENERKVVFASFGLTKEEALNRAKQQEILKDKKLFFVFDLRDMFLAIYREHILKGAAVCREFLSYLSSLDISDDRTQKMFWDKFFLGCIQSIDYLLNECAK